MARRTKEEAQATRAALLDAAELLFLEHGVSGTSLADIAAAAGTTRGAIYWHFRDKADLFNAMMERVTMPLEDALLHHPGTDGRGDPLAGMRHALHNALTRTMRDPRTRRVFEVATHMVEYTRELSAVRARHLHVRNECIAGMTRDLRLAARQRGVRLALPAAVAAQGLHAMVDGLIQNWLLDPEGFNLVTVGRRTLDAYLTGLGLGPAITGAAPT